MTAENDEPAECGARGEFSLRAPSAEAGPAVWDLIADSPPLESNSLYCNLLQCTHFADTSVLAEHRGRTVGWVSAYRPPSEPHTLFVWQIAVSQTVRGRGLGKAMIAELLKRPACRGVRRLATSITPGNHASWRLFRAIARDLNVPIDSRVWFRRDRHLANRTDTEHLVTIGLPRVNWTWPVLRTRDPIPTPKPERQPMSPRISRSTKTPDLSTFERLESEVRSYSRAFPRRFARARGAWIYDDRGEAYLDFLSGCSSLNYGHNNPALKQALLDYLAEDGLTHSLDMHTTAKQAFLEEFDRTVLRPRGLKYRMMFPGPTGANAVEAALKMARKVTGRHNVIAFTNGFHGMTLGALSCTGNAGHRAGAGVALGGVAHEPYDGYFGPGIDTAEQLERRLSDRASGLDAPAAILLEVVQGEGGLNVASEAWLRRIERIARKHGALLIVDEIQTGCGRTGTFFAFERAGLQPDIVTLAKSLSGMGLPFALTLIKAEHDLWAPGEHNGTFRGNCHAFVTATAALKHYWREGAFEKEVRRKGELLGERLAGIVEKHAPRVARPKGRGMMRGIELPSGALAGAVTKAAFEQGLILETSGGEGEVVKVLAPLTIEDGDLAAGLDILDAALAQAVAVSAKAAAA